MTPTKENITKILAKLGDTADDVATNLVEHNCQGFIGGNGGMCPVKRYISTQFPTEPEHSLIVGFTVAGISKWYDDFPVPIQVPIPLPIQDFIAKFDAREFPSLIKTL